MNLDGMAPSELTSPGAVFLTVSRSVDLQPCE